MPDDGALEGTETLHDDTPPLEAWFVVEVDLDDERDDPLYCRVTGPFATRDDAKQERKQLREAWEKAREEWGDSTPYDFKGFDIVSKHISDFRLEQLEREDEESYRHRRRAADAVAEGFLMGDEDA